MPTYTFRNKNTGETWNDFMSISKMETYLSENPDVQQVLTTINIVDPVGIGVTKPPADFQKYILGKVKEVAGAHNPAIEKRWHIAREH